MGLDWGSANTSTQPQAGLVQSPASPTTEGRVQVDEKALLNCRADLNQLVPFKYGWAWDKYIKANENHWLPQEVDMTNDVLHWKDKAKLTPAERDVVIRSLGFFSTADSLVANNIVLGIYRLITNPECRQYLLRQAFEEALHTHAYQYCIESLSMDEGEIFNMYREDATISKKSTWALEHTHRLADPEFKTDTLGGVQELLKNLVAFYGVVEGLLFYCGFAGVLSLGRKGKMVGCAKQFRYILRDESMHVNFGFDLIRGILNENKSIWTGKFQQEIKQLFIDGVELEKEYALSTIPHGIAGMSLDELNMYLEYIAQRRLKTLGIEGPYAGARNAMEWLASMTDLRSETNFFEGRVEEYKQNPLGDW